MKNILLVDNDESYRSEISVLLKAIGHHVSEAVDGEEAKGLILNGRFDLIISEVHIPKCDGIQLLKWAKENSDAPLILITSSNELHDMSVTNELDTAGFLAKPFQIGEVEKVITHVLDGSSATMATMNVDDNFCKVPLAEFINTGKISYSVYHRLDKNKYIKIAHRGEDLESSRIGKYKTKGLKDLYLTKIDFAKFVNPNLDLMKSSEPEERVTTLKKEKFLIFTAKLIRNQIFINGVDKDVFASATEFVQTILRLVQEQPATFNLLESLNRHSDHLYAHALGVSVYGVILAREIGWQSSAELYKVSMAGFFHDIGLKMIPKELSEKTRVEMTNKDKGIYESHTQHGMDLVKHLPGSLEEIVTACHQHHEDGLGNGYPLKLVGSQIAPMARIIGLVDTFCELTITRPGLKKLTAPEAISAIIEKGRAFDPDYVSALKVIFNYGEQQTIKKTAT
jgi:HD-GYP domain-containing protein (c-di-GMP phosphodiesterase class II)/ActR/RegA family two-component response regulator